MPHPQATKGNKQNEEEATGRTVRQLDSIASSSMPRSFSHSSMDTEEECQEFEEATSLPTRTLRSQKRLTPNEGKTNSRHVSFEDELETVVQIDDISPIPTRSMRRRMHQEPQFHSDIQVDSVSDEEGEGGGGHTPTIRAQTKKPSKHSRQPLQPPPHIQVDSVSDDEAEGGGGHRPKIRAQTKRPSKDSRHPIQPPPVIQLESASDDEAEGGGAMQPEAGRAQIRRAPVGQQRRQVFLHDERSHTLQQNQQNIQVPVNIEQTKLPTQTTQGAQNSKIENPQITINFHPGSHIPNATLNLLNQGVMGGDASPKSANSSSPATSRPTAAIEAASTPTQGRDGDRPTTRQAAAANNPNLGSNGAGKRQAAAAAASTSSQASTGAIPKVPTQKKPEGLFVAEQAHEESFLDDDPVYIVLEVEHINKNLIDVCCILLFAAVDSALSILKVASTNAVIIYFDPTTQKFYACFVEATVARTTRDLLLRNDVFKSNIASARITSKPPKFGEMVECNREKGTKKKSTDDSPENQ